MSVGLFRKKPVEVQALQFTGENAEEVVSWVEEGVGRHTPAVWSPDAQQLVVQTLKGEMIVVPGAWVIRGVQGEHYPCDAEIFEQSYDVVAEPKGAPEGLGNQDVSSRLGNQELANPLRSRAGDVDV